MENSTRERAKQHFPAVLLTLLSIVQAIALELLWGHTVEAPALQSFTIDAVLDWAQLAATLLVIVLIWVVYASNVMRFRWVPTVPDSIYPFAVGILEFWLVETLGGDSPGLWLLVMGGCYGAMIWIAQITMRKARHDPDNARFFDGLEPATLADFYPQMTIFLLFAIVGGTSTAGMLPAVAGDTAVVLTLLFLAWQFRRSAHYWSVSIASKPSD